jgi:hypothetical protein
MRDELKTGAFRPVAGAFCRGWVFAETAYKEPISLRRVRNKPVAAKNYFIKDIAEMSSKIFFSAGFFRRVPRPTLVKKLLTLALLVLGVLADDHDFAFALDDLALLAHGLHGRSDFHIVIPPTSTCFSR